jgi:hypothetical protein
MASFGLPLFELSKRHPGLTQAISDNYIEAASVCLDRHHIPPEEFSLMQEGNSTEAIEAMINWVRPDNRTRHAWANESDATRDGAYACALAAVELVHGMVAIKRAETLTGADYYIGKLGQTFEDFENCLRLEVSGIDKGSHHAVTQRLKQKITQAIAGRSNLPAIACVVSFQVKEIVLQSVGAS